MQSLEQLKAQLEIIDKSQTESLNHIDKRNVYSGLDWEIGLGVSTNVGENSTTPYITVSFKSTNSEGKIDFHNVTFSPQQFADFSQNVVKMQKAVSSFA